MRKRIFALVNKYPNVLEPNVCVFIQSLIWSFADLNYDCSVICPLPINLNLKYLRFPKKRIEKNESGKIIEIYHPRYISLGQSNKLLQKLRVKITTFCYKKACNRVLKHMDLDSSNDIIYSHFICPSGVAAALLGKKYGVKSFMAHGEAIYAGNTKYGNNYLKKVFEKLHGVVAVSTQNRDYLINAGVLSVDKIGIFPNGYRKERFYKINKTKARRHFNWNNEDFIVGFCGSFDVRKGILRVEQAVDLIDDKNLYFACAGNGKLCPTSKKCILASPVNNDELVYFYNAIDVFCLPTQNEGCCNAIVEAMACGCPIISSDRSFNYDILDEANSIMVDPNDVEAIKSAIISLKNNSKLLTNMSLSSLEKAKKLTIEKRAVNIINYFNSN